MNHLIVLAAAVLLLSSCEKSVSDCNSECMRNKTDIAVIQSQLAIQEGRIEDLESEKVQSEERLAVSEANIASLSDKPRESPGGWIIWESKALADNPRGILFASLPKPKPMGSYDEQQACMDDAMQTATANGGKTKDGRFYTQGDSGVVWHNSYTCLPKGVDPR